MADDPEHLREKIRRYENLRALNPDERARAVLEEMIKEVRAKLAETTKAKPT